MRAGAKASVRTFNFTSRWPSSSDGGLQSRRGWCDSSTGFHFFGHRCWETHALWPCANTFQTGVEGALASWPSIFRDAKSRCRSELHRSGRGGSTPPSCRVRVANFDSEVPALNRRELGANPRRPTIFRIRGEIYYHPPLRTESLQVGVLPDAPIHAALVQLQETLRSGRRGWGWKTLTRHHFAHADQRRDGALKTRTVSVRFRPWAPTACSSMKRRSAQDGKVAGSSPATRTNLECQPVKRTGPVC